MKEKGEEKKRRIEERSGKKGSNWRDKRRERKKRTGEERRGENKRGEGRRREERAAGGGKRPKKEVETRSEKSV